MKNNQRVVCVMLVNGRQEMAQRALQAFELQEYPNCSLLVYDTGKEPIALSGGSSRVLKMGQPSDKPIGQLRNEANALAVEAGGAEVLMHWDSDDWSSCGRIWDQLTLLYSSGAEAVGYHQMLFWKHTHAIIREQERNIETLPSGDRMMKFSPFNIDDNPGGGAWLYSSPNTNTCLGTSLMYWAKVWQANPFPDKHTAEDHLWCLKRKVSAVSAGVHQPRMIASIHGANTCSKITPGAREWKRAPESDDLCRGLMQL